MSNSPNVSESTGGENPPAIKIITLAELDAVQLSRLCESILDGETSLGGAYRFTGGTREHLEVLLLSGLPHMRKPEHDFADPHQTYLAMDGTDRCWATVGLYPLSLSSPIQLDFSSDLHYFGMLIGMWVHPDAGEGLAAGLRYRVLRRVQGYANKHRSECAVYHFAPIGVPNPLAGLSLPALNMSHSQRGVKEDAGGERYSVFRTLIVPGRRSKLANINNA